MKPLTYPARPLNGGRFGLVPRRDTYLWSPKLNGWRALVHTPTGTMFNRQGEELSIANEFHEALENLSRSGIPWLDCEALERRHNIGRGTLIILDAVIPEYTASDRWRVLLEETDKWQWPILNIGDKPLDNQVYLCKQTAYSDASPSGKNVLSNWWHWMQALNKEWSAEFYEGFVAKRLDSAYPIQLRNPESECPFWVKHRWYK